MFQSFFRHFISGAVITILILLLTSVSDSYAQTPLDGEWDQWNAISTPAFPGIAWMKYATPQWVEESGAKGTFYVLGKGRVAESGSWDPFFDDPIFLEEQDLLYKSHS